MPPWLTDLLIFIGITVAVFYIGIATTVWGLNAYSMRRLRGPARRFGLARARELFRQLQETGEAPPELEGVMAEMRAMGCGGDNQMRYPPNWVLSGIPLVVGLGVAWLIVYA